jgi:hypothetical protein
LKEHEVPDSLINKEIEKWKIGPSNYDPSHKLTEPRQDVGVGNHIFRLPIKPISEVPEEQEEGPDMLGPEYGKTL